MGKEPRERMMDDAEHARRVHDRLEQGSDEILKGERWDELRRLPADELAVRHDACLIRATEVIGTDVKGIYLERAGVYRTEQTPARRSARASAWRR
jgi:hypothetical protein